MARETWVQSQVESYQRLKKWYLMLPRLTPSIIRYGSRVKWSNLGKGVAPSPTPWRSSYRIGRLRVTLDYHDIYIYIFCSHFSCVEDTQFSCGEGSCRKIIANWVIWARWSDVARPETPFEPKGNITDDTSQCINEDVWYKYLSIYIYIYIYIYIPFKKWIK